MAYHFKFTLSDVDTQNLMDCLRDSVLKQTEHITDAALAGKIAELEWHQAHKVYLERLISQVVCTHED